MYKLRKRLLLDKNFVEHIALEKLKDFNHQLEKAKTYIQSKEIQKADKATTTRSEKKNEKALLQKLRK